MSTRDLVESDNKNEVYKLSKLKATLSSATTHEDRSYILDQHISWGNSKISSNVGILNITSAEGCINRSNNTVGKCAVGEENCYARVPEKIFEYVLDYRKRQEFIWDYLTGEEIAHAFIKIVNRKNKDVVALRISESGDFRHNYDIVKAEKIATILKEQLGIKTYTYSSSYKLDWSNTNNLIVMESCSDHSYGDKSYIAVENEEEIPARGIICPNERDKKNNVENPIKCGTCRLCMQSNGEDIYTVIR